MGVRKGNGGGVKRKMSRTREWGRYRGKKGEKGIMTMGWDESGRKTGRSMK